MTKTIERAVLTGGGTGGHIFPAIALAQGLQAANPQVELLFIGGRGGMEAELVPKHGYQFVGVPIAGLQRQLSLHNVWRNLALPFKLTGAYLSCISTLRRMKPQVVIGTGGYASLPALLAARSLGIAVVLNEQNAAPGLVTQWNAKAAQLVLLGNADAAKHLPGARCNFTGNPVRGNIIPGDKQAARKLLQLAPDAKLLLVLGGSLGARSINQALLAQLPTLQQAGVQVWWQCGKLYYDALKEKVQQTEHLRLVPFIADMATAYAAADLVLSRAGALTLSEIAAAEKASVLVPSPNVAADHQTANALSLTSRGAALLLPDRELAEKMAATVVETLKSAEKIYAIENSIRTLPRSTPMKAVIQLIAESID